MSSIIRNCCKILLRQLPPDYFYCRKTMATRGAGRTGGGEGGEGGRCSPSFETVSPLWCYFSISYFSSFRWNFIRFFFYPKTIILIALVSTIGHTHSSTIIDRHRARTTVPYWSWWSTVDAVDDRPDLRRTVQQQGVFRVCVCARLCVCVLRAAWERHHKKNDRIWKISTGMNVD